MDSFLPSKNRVESEKRNEESLNKYANIKDDSFLFETVKYTEIVLNAQCWYFFCKLSIGFFKNNKKNKKSLGWLFAYYLFFQQLYLSIITIREWKLLLDQKINDQNVRLYFSWLIIRKLMNLKKILKQQVERKSTDIYKNKTVLPTVPLISHQFP